MSSIYDFKVKGIDGNEVDLSQFRGKVLVIVNTASKCGFTPQYQGLEELYQNYKDKGLVVLGFPCNQFGAQEPGDENEIKNFCNLTYKISFPMFAKIDVNGPKAAPLYEYLKSECKGLLGSEAIKWNFTKFIVDKNGIPVKRFAPQTKPQDMKKDIEAFLN
ncbi:MAG: glutathione peroxidase [Bdellovibrio sp.]